MMAHSKMESYASEYCMSGSDNAVSRDKMNKSIISQATANEHSYAQALMAGLNDIKKQRGGAKDG